MTTELTVKSTTDLVSDSVMTFEEMMAACPNPTDGELRKMLAVQGYALNMKGLQILDNCIESSGKVSTVKGTMAQKLLAASREALKAASDIEDKTEVIDLQNITLPQD